MALQIQAAGLDCLICPACGGRGRTEKGIDESAIGDGLTGAARGNLGHRTLEAL
jgi:hypothetical protein